MLRLLAQTSSTWNWNQIIKVAIPLIIFVIIPLLRKLKSRAQERAAEKQKTSAQSAAEFEAIRTGRGMEQVLLGSPSAGAPTSNEPLTETDDPKARRERQLAELRRRAAVRSGQGSGVPPLTSRQIPIPVPSGTQSGGGSRQIRIQLPDGGTVDVGRSQSPPPRPAPKPQARPVQQPQKQQRPQRMTNEQAARQANQRQAVPTRVQNTMVSDISEGSETHRLVADTEAARVTARPGRKGPVLGRAGLRQAMIMSEIFGRPRSERLGEI